MSEATQNAPANAPVSGRKRFLAIAGNIAAGKSSLTGLLAKGLGFEPFYEAHAENPYLADFYDEMERWSFHSQVFFLSRRLQHHRQLVDHPNSVVQDRSVYEDAEIFARNLFWQGHMSNRDYDTYRALYEGVRAFLPPPDLLVYLKARVGTLVERIAMRGRTYERQISIDYLAQLNTLYDEWTGSWTACPVLVLAADDLDFVHNEADFARVQAAVQTALVKLP
ncbi:MAG: deoxynucleoside kinase [Anaerolineae bacterium]|nr:deoxynucleoside kinase [Anaerolineae bacterium]